MQVEGVGFEELSHKDVLPHGSSNKDLPLHGSFYKDILSIISKVEETYHSIKTIIWISLC